MKALFGFISILFTFYSCETLKKECRVTGEYKNYTCPEGYDKISDFTQLNSNLYYDIDTCTHSFINSEGCAFVINDSTFLNEILLKNRLNIPIEDSAYWNFKTHTIIGFKEETNLGSELFDSIFISVNHEKESYLIKCQYEISNQCAGSDIYPLLLYKIISRPKLNTSYKIEFDVEDVNPF